MGLFDFGGSRSDTRSRSDSSSRSFDNLDSFGFNFGSSSSAGRSRSRVAFEDQFRQLFGGAGAAAAGIDTGALGGAADLLFSSGGRFLNQLEGGGAGADYLEGRLRNPSAIGDTQIRQLGEDIGRFLSEDVNPNITAGGVAAGTLGGSRGEVQRGIASEAALRQFVRGATDIRTREQAATDEAAGTLLGSLTARSGAALQSLPSLFGLAEGGALSSLSPYMMLAQIMGGPLALTDSESVASSLDIGADSTTGRAGSQSRSTSSTDSSSRSISFGFG